MYDVINVSFREKQGAGEVEVVLAYAVVTTSSLFVMAMLSNAEFSYLLVVFTPIHIIIYCGPIAEVIAVLSDSWAKQGNPMPKTFQRQEQRILNKILVVFKYDYQRSDRQPHFFLHNLVVIF